MKPRLKKRHQTHRPLPPFVKWAEVCNMQFLIGYLAAFAMGVVIIGLLLMQAPTRTELLHEIQSVKALLTQEVSS